MRHSFLRVCSSLLLFAVAATGFADTANLDPTYNPPLGYAKVGSFLGTNTYLSARPRRLLVSDSGVHYLVGTGQTAIGVSPAQSAVTVVSRSADGTLNSSFFGIGRRAFKLAPGGVLTDTVVEDAVLVPKSGILIVGRFIGAPGGYALMLDFFGNTVASFGTAGARYFSDLQPSAVAVDPAGIYVVGTFAGGLSGLDVRVRALSFTGADRTSWGSFGTTAWGYIDQQSAVNYDDRPVSAAVSASGRLVIVGSSRRPGDWQTVAHYLILTASGGFGNSNALSPSACAPGATSEFAFERVVAEGETAYVALRETRDNAGCPEIPRNSFGVVAINTSGGGLSNLGASSTRASCCGGDGAALALTDLARDARGRLYLSFSTNFPGGVSRGHLVRFDPATVVLAPDPTFGDAGFGTYNLDTPGADATLTAIALDTEQRLHAAGGFTSDILGNPFNVDHWVFRVRDETLFRNGFEQ